MKQCVLTDVYSLGKLLGRITSSARLVGLEDDSLERVQQLIRACTSMKPNGRPTARRICEVFEQISKNCFDTPIIIYNIIVIEYYYYYDYLHHTPTKVQKIN